MHETDIKRECKLTWAINHGNFNQSMEVGKPPSTKKIKVSSKGKVSIKRSPGMTDDEWQEVKQELRFYQKYVRSLKTRGGDVRRAHDNTPRILKGLEAGGVLARIDKLGFDVKLWTYLAYKEDLPEHKARAFKILAASIANQYMAKRSLKDADFKRITIITLYQLSSILNEYDKRFPGPTPKKALNDYKNPRDFKLRHKEHFYNIDQIIRLLDSKAKAREGN